MGPVVADVPKYPGLGIQVPRYLGRYLGSLESTVAGWTKTHEEMLTATQENEHLCSTGIKGSPSA